MGPHAGRRSRGPFICRDGITVFCVHPLRRQPLPGMETLWQGIRTLGAACLRSGHGRDSGCRGMMRGRGWCVDRSLSPISLINGAVPRLRAWKKRWVRPRRMAPAQSRSAGPVPGESGENSADNRAGWRGDCKGCHACDVGGGRHVSVRLSPMGDFANTRRRSGGGCPTLC